MSFSKELSVGNRAIDLEHKNLFTTIRWLSEAVVAGQLHAITEGFHLLDDLLSHYFEVEERIARAVNFDFTQHRLTHQRLQNEIHSIKTKFLAGHGMWSKAEEKGHIDSLMNCLTRHVKEDANPLKLEMDTHLYDFTPD